MGSFCFVPAKIITPLASLTGITVLRFLKKKRVSTASASGLCFFDKRNYSPLQDKKTIPVRTVFGGLNAAVFYRLKLGTGEKASFVHKTIPCCGNAGVNAEN